MVDRADWWHPGNGPGTEAGKRPPVVVTSIAPPAVASRPSYGVLIGAVPLWFFGIGSLIAGLKVRPFLGWWSLLLIAQAAVCGFFAWQLSRAFVREVRAIRRRGPETSELSPPAVDVEAAISGAILRQWTHPDSPPRAAAVLEAVRSIEREPAVARLICLNVAEIPPAEDYRFEPEIIPPIRSLAFPLGFAAVGAAIVAAWAMQFVPGVPWRFDLWSVPCLVIPALVFGMMSLWALWIRPQYVRCAPGVIQMLRYSWRGGPPTVRSYPMTAGTVVVVSRKGKELTVALFRDGLKDTLAVAEMTRAKEVEEIVWKSLRSTAPIPRLDESELLG